LHEGEGFAGPWTRAEVPWNLGSDATAWLSPAYPALIALIFSMFGGLVPAAAFALFFVQSVVSAITCVALAELGRVVGAARAGVVAGWVFAFYPPSIWNASAVVWDTTFVAFGLVLFLWSAFAFARAGVAVWAAIGAGFGALLLLNAAPMVVVPAALLPLWRARESTQGFVSRALAFALVAFVVVLPWMLRNQRELGALALRTNLGVELAVGNNDQANGRFQLSHHPSNSAPEFLRYRELGEVAYCAHAMSKARAWIGEHPARFGELCALRLCFFWIGQDPITDPRTDAQGRKATFDLRSWVKFLSFALVGVLGLAGTVRWARFHMAGRVLLVVFLLFPVAYCITHVLERYRFPIEPLLVLAAVWMILDLRAGRTTRPLSSGPS
jgi:4-amino-4-deoxy-L-arabinose transferase-like glycosyltransferase